jgi:RNase P/RNase MRP subunit p30
LNAIDLDVRISKEEELPHFLDMAKSLGFSGIASTLSTNNKITDTTPLIYSRINLETRKLSTLKKHAADARSKYSVIAIPILGVETANWAAEDSRIDILTVDYTGKNVLRKTTASMSANHGTALEICIAPLLGCNGLERSKIIRNIHDSITVATRSGMKIVLSSGATSPIHMRSPVALRHIGMTLGLDRKEANEALLLNPQELITKNRDRIDGNHIGPGIEVIKGDDL